jgi:DNA ligase-1
MPDSIFHSTPHLMKCAKDRSRITFPAYAQRKADGNRILIISENGKISPISSSGNLHTSLHKITNALHGLGDLVLDGELVFTDKQGKVLPRKASSGLGNKSIRQTITQEEADRAVITLWDTIPLEDYKKAYCPFATDFRFLTTEHLVEQLNVPFIKIIDKIVVGSWEDVEEFYQYMRSLGEEGIVVKNRGASWKAHRSPYHIKMKAEETADLRIVEMVEGTGKAKNMMGAIRCKNDEGTVDVWVGTGFDDKTRIDFWMEGGYIGKIVELKYNEVITSKTSDVKSLFLPVFVRLRPDKLDTNKLEDL